MKVLAAPMFALALALAVPAVAQAAEPPLPSLVLISDVNIFDGTSDTLHENIHVLIKDNLIETVSHEPLMVTQTDNVTMIDGGGRTLIPGLIDAHWHSTYCCTAQSTVITGDIMEIAIRGAMGSEETLLRGFTTVRDVGGNPFSIKKMIDAGEIIGPRIFPSGPPITQTGGHLDYRPYQAVPSNPADSLWYWYHSGLMLQADGVPEVILRSREVMRMGASQIKIAAGGGVSSLYDALVVRQYT